jgi:cytochrome c oxidase subunit 2
MRQVLLAVAAVAALASWPQGSATPPAVREVEVVAEKFKFTPERIEVNQGDLVRVTVRSADVTHGWEIKAFDVDAYARKGGRPETVEFVADRAGSFEITCSEYCGRGHKRMKGVLVVNPGGR